MKISSFLIPHNARELAYLILCQGVEDSELASSRLELTATEHGIAGQDRRLAKELVNGTIRRLLTLDSLLAPLVRRGQADVEPTLWMLMRMGAYQLVLMDGIPPHAAVHETVELARRVGRGGWPGFVNGVLRSVTRLVTDEIVDAPAVDAVPLNQGRYRRLTQAVFADPQLKPAEYLSKAFSYPRWLADHWLQLVSPDEALRLAQWFNTPGHVSLRVNRCRTTPAAFREALQAAGVEVQPGNLPESLRLAGSTRIEDLPGFQEGWFSVQDESATAAARLLDPQPGEHCLDLCAAPGGKTTHLAELQGDQGVVVACDVQAERLELVTKNAERLRLKSIQTSLVAKDGSDVPAGPFDAVLVDVPCTNSGVLGKRPEVRWRMSPYDVVEMPALQERLLDLAITRTRPGGRIVYSTCSIEPAENQQLVQRALARHPELKLVTEQQHFPGQPGDGAYQALLQVGQSS